MAVELYNAVCTGDVDRVLEVLSRHPPEEVINTRIVRNQGISRTPVLVATEKGYEEIVTCLLDHGTDISCEIRNAPPFGPLWRHYLTGSTALHLAIRYGHEFLVDLLLSRGADPLHPDS